MAYITHIMACHIYYCFKYHGCDFLSPRRLRPFYTYIKLLKNISNHILVYGYSKIFVIIFQERLKISKKYCTGRANILYGSFSFSFSQRRSPTPSGTSIWARPVISHLCGPGNPIYLSEDSSLVHFHFFKIRANILSYWIIKP
jgi:hypothetical protein